MQRPERKRKQVLCAVALVTVLSVATRLQAHQSQQPIPGPTTQIPTSQIPGGSATSGFPHEPDPLLAHQQEVRTRMAEDERHKRMVSDADKLLELATELKTDVDKSTRNETSVSALKKADEIERLAHDVKERLKN